MTALTTRKASRVPRVEDLANIEPVPGVPGRYRAISKVELHDRHTKAEAAQTAKLLAPKEDREYTFKSKLEAAYALHLEFRRKANDLLEWKYEELKLILKAKHCTYTPDFPVWTMLGFLEIHEVKGGYMWEDAWIKLKLAVQQFPRLPFYVITREDGSWRSERVQP